MTPRICVFPVSVRRSNKKPHVDTNSNQSIRVYFGGKSFKDSKWNAARDFQNLEKGLNKPFKEKALNLVELVAEAFVAMGVEFSFQELVPNGIDFFYFPGDEFCSVLVRFKEKVKLSAAQTKIYFPISLGYVWNDKCLEFTHLFSNNYQTENALDQSIDLTNLNFGWCFSLEKADLLQLDAFKQFNAPLTKAAVRSVNTVPPKDSKTPSPPAIDKKRALEAAEAQSSVTQSPNSGFEEESDAKQPNKDQKGALEAAETQSNVAQSPNSGLEEKSDAKQSNKDQEGGA